MAGGWDIGGNIKAEVDMVVGGGGLAVIGHYADRAAAVGFLQDHNISNSEGLYAANLLASALFRNKVRGQHVQRMWDGSVAYAAGALVADYLNGQFAQSGTAMTTETHTPSGGSVTGFEAMDPNLDWGGSVTAGGSGGYDADSMSSGFGID